MSVCPCSSCQQETQGRKIWISWAGVVDVHEMSSMLGKDVRQQWQSVTFLVLHLNISFVLLLFLIFRAMNTNIAV